MFVVIADCILCGLSFWQDLHPFLPQTRLEHQERRSELQKARMGTEQLRCRWLKRVSARHILQGTSSHKGIQKELYVTHRYSMLLPYLLDLIGSQYKPPL